MLFPLDIDAGGLEDAAHGRHLVEADLRKAVFRHVLTLDQAHFLKTRTGEVLSRLTTDMTMVEQVVGNVVPVALRNLLTLIGALSIMVFFSPKFVGLVLILVPVLITPLIILGRRMRRLVMQAPGGEVFAAAAECAAEAVDPMEDVHNSARYRRDLVRAMVRRALEQAAKDAA